MNRARILAAITILAMGAVTARAAERSAPAAAPAARHAKANGVYSKGGKIFVMRDGEATPMTSAVVLQNGMKITPDGTAYLKDGSKLGKMKSDDPGMLMDGTFAVRLLKGKMMVVAAGAAPRPLARDLVLMNGAVAKTDGSVVKPDGTKRKLQDHEAVLADGTIGPPSSK